MSEQGPLPRAVAWRAVGRSIVTTGRLMTQHRIHQPPEHLGRRLRFADGSQAQIYRETTIDRPAAAHPCVLIVAFRLRGVHGRAHLLFRWESLLNTPLFAGFPGMISKLWLAHDDHETYRGVYEWDGVDSAESYARALWRVLELVSAPDSIQYYVLPGLRRDQLLRDPQVLTEIEPAGQASWWRLVGLGS